MSLSTYESPLTTRYLDEPLGKIWGPRHTRNLWRIFWFEHLFRTIDLMDVDGTPDVENLLLGLTSWSMYTEGDLEESQRLEEIVKHELVAELISTEEKYPELKGLLHLGCTSSDVQDYATYEQLDQSHLRLSQLFGELMQQLTQMIGKHHNTPMLGMTHLRWAEPTTFGYRLAVYQQELRAARNMADMARAVFPHPQPLGAVGTGSNLEMLGVTPFSYSPAPLKGQTYPRQQELRLLQAWGDCACTLSKMAHDLRLMFSHGQIDFDKDEGYQGSSAMPGKKNPIGLEKIGGLSRRIPHLINEMWHIASLSHLERTLDDSSSRRSLLPDFFLLMAEILTTMTKELKDLTVREDRCMSQILTHWESWLPSRLQTKRQADGHPLRQSQINDLVEHAAGDWRIFWSWTSEDQFPKHLSDLLFLKSASEAALESIKPWTD